MVSEWSDKLKKRAKNLRRKGKTYSEIQNDLNKHVPKGTISNWCKNVELPHSYYKKVGKRRLENLRHARAKAVEANREKRKQFRENLRDKNSDLVSCLEKGTKKIILSILYLGEGKKHEGTRYLGFANTDPEIIKMYLALLKQCFEIDEDKFRVSIMCRADQTPELLEEYWHDVIGIPRSQFYHTRVDQRTEGDTTKNKSYKGVCDICYFDTSIQLELEELAQQIIRSL